MNPDLGLAGRGMELVDRLRMEPSVTYVHRHELRGLVVAETILSHIDD